jgi:hypothetical protein
MAHFAVLVLPVTLLASELQVQATTVSYFQALDCRDLSQLSAQLITGRVKKPTEIVSIHLCATSDCQLNLPATKEPV